MAEHVGQCHCGQLRVVVTGEPESVSVCYCRACQRRTGSAFGQQAAFAAAQVRVEGRANEFVRVSDEADRMEHVFQFCPDCGSTVLITEPSQPHLVTVAAGVFADPEFPEPTRAGYDHLRPQWLVVANAEPEHGQDFDLWNAHAKQLYEDGRYAEAAETGRALLREHPDQVFLHYNVACCESLAGRPTEALAHLRQAIDAWEGFQAMAANDGDFAALRGLPGFSDLTGVNR